MFFQINILVMYTRVAKKPEFLKPDPTRIFDPPRVPDPKKSESIKA